MRVVPTIRTTVCVLVAASVALIVSSAAFATAADPNAIVRLEQPDGRSFLAHIWGDEYIHGYEALNGRTVLKDPKTGFWRYAERGPRGTLEVSDAVVTRDRAAFRKHLRPAPSRFTAVRAREHMPPVGMPLLQAAPPWAGDDTDVLFIMVEFSDLECTFTPAQMQTNMFGGGASGPAGADLDDYYDEISYGDVEFVGNIVGQDGGTADCLQLTGDRNSYNNNTSNADGDDDLVREAVAALVDDLDFTQYDNDDDGTIDALGIIYAGGGPHDGCAAGVTADNLWPHSGRLANPGPTVTADGDTINPFIINSELTYPLSALPGIVPADCTVIQTIGLFAHELGHSLGLPDLYDDDASPNGGSGVDVWSAMASQYLGTTNNADTPPHFDPWSKWHQEWLTPTGHAAGDRFVESISRAEDSTEVHRFLDNPSGVDWALGPPVDPGTGEYFLVENRQQTLFDAQLPGCGIVVWHIDETRTGNQGAGHTAGSHRLVDIEEADGLAELDGNGQNAADAGDPFPGSTNKRLFDGSGTPNSDLYSGADSNVRMWVQSTACGSTMSAAFGPNQAPTADAGGPYTPDEGSSVQLTAAGSSDPDSGDTLTYEWDLDNDGDFDEAVTSQTPTFPAKGDNGVFTVRVRVTDTFGSSATDTATVTVNNVKPAVDELSNTGPKPENTAVTISGLISDPGWLDTFPTVTVDWDDGAGPQALSGTTENLEPDATFTFTDVAHTYGDNGTYTVTVCATDDDGATTAPCGVTSIIIQNVNPTAVIDLTGTVLVNGVATYVAHVGQVVPFNASSFDPGSDDRTTTWNWDDGPPAPDVTTLSLNNAAFNPDPPKSPTINPRTVFDPEPHAFAEACFYNVGFGARDEVADGGSASANVAVIIAGNASQQRGAGYWQTQYRPRPTAFTETRRLCYLAITRFMSTVFIEQRPLGTVAQAFNVLNVSNNGGSETQKLERELLASWLNFANGAFDLTELVDTDGNGSVDTAFATVMTNAEAVRIGPSTDAQKIAQRNILQRINGS